jgi:hypothetical protein
MTRSGSPQPGQAPDRDPSKPRKPSFTSTTDDPLATAGTGGREDHSHTPRTGDRNAASVAESPVKDEDEITEGPGPAEGRTDNKAGG